MEIIRKRRRKNVSIAFQKQLITHLKFIKIKSLKFVILLVFVSILSACDKEYTCTYTDDQTGEIVNASIYELSKNDAESACNNAEVEVGVTCVLD